MTFDLKKYAVLKNLKVVLKQKSNDKGASFHRYLGTDKEGLVAAVINLAYGREKGGIELVKVPTLHKAIEAGKVFIFDVEEKRSDLTTAQKAFQDKAWKLLEPFRDRSDMYFDRRLHNQLINEVAQASSTAPGRVRYLLRRFLQGGCTYQGLRCGFSNCGIRGKGKTPYGAPRGRPSPLKEVRGRLTGRPIDADLIDRFHRGIKSELLGLNNKNVSRPQAFENILIRYFRTTKIVNGAATLDYDPTLPTYDQFRYFLRKFYPGNQIAKSRKTAASHGTSDRAKTSEKVSLRPRGPNDIFLIDSTDADIHLLAAEGGRQLIGRARIYLVRDAYTRLIVGFHFTLGAASYEEAVCAIINVLEDKQEICARLKVPYHPTDWPAFSLAGTIIADRQELVSVNSDLFIKRLAITLTNPPGYRGDLKGLIEAGLGATMKITWRLPGGVDPRAGRDERDYRENAIYCFEDFQRITLMEIIKINSQYQKGIPVQREVAKAGIEKIPSKLYTWAKKQLSGFGLTASLDKVRRALSPITTTATAKTVGIYVSAADVTGIIYRAEEGTLPGHLFEKGEGMPLTAQYDPRSMNVVWVDHPETHIFVPCYLSMAKNPEYKDLSWAEGDEYQLLCKKQAAESKDANLAREAEFYDILSDTTDKARARALADGPVTRTQIKRGQKEARKQEHNAELRKRPAITSVTDSSEDNDW